MSGRRHGRAVHEEHENSERWLLTYADMITLLLALFIVLFALSSISQKKFLAFRMGLTQTFNPSAIATSGGSGLLQQSSLIDRPGSNPSPTPVLAGTSAPTSAAPSASTTAARLKAALEKAGLGKNASVTITAQGVVVQILADRVFFSSDSATFEPVGNAVVDTIAQVIRSQPNSVQVEGFTDNVPVTGGPFTSNWELSAVRVANVVDRMNVTDHIPTTRLAAVGYAETHPQASNSTTVGQAKNRRVDVVILNT